MLVKLSSEMLAAIGGGANAAEAQTNLTAFIAKAKENETFMAESKTTLETLQASVTALEGKLSGLLTAAQAKELIGAEVTPAIAGWASSAEGKKIIGGEASRITMEALAAVGTQPAQPSPAPAAGGTSEDQAKAFIAAGKFEEAYPLLPKAEQSEFMGAKSYAAYMKNRRNTVISGK
jgi:hypothetical protein